MGPIRVMLLPGAVLPAQPAGIEAFLRTFRSYDLDRGRLAAFDAPVLFVLGGLSNPDQFGEIAGRLSTVFPDFRLEVFTDRHHFDPPHRVEPERLGRLLREYWDRAERGHRSISWRSAYLAGAHCGAAGHRPTAPDVSPHRRSRRSKPAAAPYCTRDPGRYQASDDVKGSLGRFPAFHDSVDRTTGVWP